MSATRPIQLFYGSDDALIADRARKHVARLGAAVRVTDLDATALLKDPAELFDLFATTALFDEPRLLRISGVSDRLHSIIADWLSNLPRALDTKNHVLFLSTSLRAKSKALAALKAAPHAQVTACYDAEDPNQLIKDAMTEAGIDRLADDVRPLLLDLARSLTSLELATLFRKLTLHAGPGAPITIQDLAACAPPSSDAADDLYRQLRSAREPDLVRAITDPTALGDDLDAAMPRLSRTLSGLFHGVTGAQSAPWPLRDDLAALRRDRRGAANALETGLRNLHMAEAEERQHSDLQQEKRERALLNVARALRKTASTRR